MVAHLGTAPDSVVAEWLGLDSRQVTYQRRKREIPAFADPSVAEISNRLTPALLVKLKYMSASALSAQTGICRNKLNKARKDLGISPRVPGRQPDPMLLDALGTLPDSALAERFGLSVSNVKRLRRQRGIASFRDQNRPAFTPDVLELLGKQSDRAVAEQFGLTAREVRARRIELGIPAKGKVSTPLTEQQIKVLTDNTLLIQQKAHALGVSNQKISIWLQRLGLAVEPNFKTGRPRKPLPAGVDKLLGKISDNQIAQQFGISRLKVAQRREQLGIPAFVRRVVPHA